MGQHIFVPHNESVTTPLFNISSMKIISSGWVLTGLMLVSFASLQAQMPTDAIMMAKGQLCVAATYTNDTWDEYWEGTLKRTNGNIGTLTRQTVSPMFALGLNERVNVMAALPWVSTKSTLAEVLEARRSLLMAQIEQRRFVASQLAALATLRSLGGTR